MKSLNQSMNNSPLTLPESLHQKVVPTKAPTFNTFVIILQG